MINFDSILDATEARINGTSLTGGSGNPTILSVNNDLSSINFVAGLADPGEMIGCGMYQQLRRQAGETDQAYAARLRFELTSLPAEHRATIEAALIGAAQKRAALDVSTGQVALLVAGQQALEAHWHGLGVRVAEAVTSEQAERLAKLDWTVEKT